MNRRRLLLALLGFLIVIGGLVYWRLTSRPAVSALSSTIPALPAPGTPEDKTRQQLLGTWQDDYQGKRTMTLNADGTGTMLVELSGVQATLFASQLRFDMQWSLEGDKLVKKTVSGEPANKVNMILNTMGDTAADAILELTEEKLLLLDQNGKTRYEWRRVKLPKGD